MLVQTMTADSAKASAKAILKNILDCEFKRSFSLIIENEDTYKRTGVKRFSYNFIEGIKYTLYFSENDTRVDIFEHTPVNPDSDFSKIKYIGYIANKEELDVISANYSLYINTSKESIVHVIYNFLLPSKLSSIYDHITKLYGSLEDTMGVYNDYIDIRTITTASLLIIN